MTRPESASSDFWSIFFFKGNLEEFVDCWFLVYKLYIFLPQVNARISLTPFRKGATVPSVHRYTVLAPIQPIPKMHRWGVENETPLCPTTRFQKTHLSNRINQKMSQFCMGRLRYSRVCHWAHQPGSCFSLNQFKTSCYRFELTVSGTRCETAREGAVVTPVVAQCFFGSNNSHRNAACRRDKGHEVTVELDLNDSTDQVVQFRSLAPVNEAGTQKSWIKCAPEDFRDPISLLTSTQTRRPTIHPVSGPVD